MDTTHAMVLSNRDATYHIPDHELPTGSTLGAPTVCAVVKATGALAQVYSVAAGQVLIGTLVLHHWDERTGLHLSPLPGAFTLHPEHQEHAFALANGVAVHEDIFVLHGPPKGDDYEGADPPAVYYTLTLRNDSTTDVCISTYAFCQIGGLEAHDMEATYDTRLGAFLAWNASQPGRVRTFGCSEKPTSVEVTTDHARALADTWPGRLSGTTDAAGSDPLAVFHLSRALAPGATASCSFLLSFSLDGQQDARTIYRQFPPADAALARTKDYYSDMLSRSVVVTPNRQINRGVLWAKTNMLRSVLKAPTGWGFTNDPTSSSNSVARDTAWFGFGADYLWPEFVRTSLLQFVRRQEPNGMIVEYYNLRTGETEDLGLNINDDTPLLILGLWHHYTATGDEGFLTEVYPAAARAARYILTQRNEQGLVWCTSTEYGGRGILGWRNAMQGYRISGASTEVNSECFAALQRVAQMARLLGKHDESATFSGAAEALKEAINTHLLNPDTGLYYLNIDVDGRPRSDITSDLVFPVMFDVASDETAAQVIRRLSRSDFWTEAGMRVVPREAPAYSPDHASGLIGGVWVGVTFWYAFAAARFNQPFVDHALSTSFENYARNPRKNNTVPGQFSEWLHGETLVNRGMMLSPWFPPRYLWAAIEGASGLDLETGRARLQPHLSAHWKWMSVLNLPYHGQYLTWLAVRTPHLQVYTTYGFEGEGSYIVYDDDISRAVSIESDDSVALGLRRGADLLLFAGNTSEGSVLTSLRVECALDGSYRQRRYDSLLRRWRDEGRVEPDKLRRGLTLEIERQGFCLIELTQEV